jgi:putative ABC transport system substrate-binding protein
VPVRPFLDALGEPADVYNLRGREADAESLATRLQANPPEVVFALGAKAAWIVRKRLPDVPVVYVSILSPGRFDIEGRGTSGISMVAAPQRTVSQLSSFFPELRTVGILRGPSIPDARIAEMEAAAAAVGVALTVVRVAGPKDVRARFHDLALGVDAIWLQADREVMDRSTFRFVVEETQRMRLPLVVETENMVRAGGMFAVVPDEAGLGRQAAAMVRQVLAGERPDGTVAYAEDVDVVLNVGAVHSTQTPFEALMLDFVDVVVE